MAVPERPPPPVVGKVNHYSAELYWSDALEKANTQTDSKGDTRIRVAVQEEDKQGAWGTVYTGYAKTHLIESLEPWTQYRFRIRFTSNAGSSEWSQPTTLSTTKEPLTGEHVHKAIIVENFRDLQQILESGEVQPDIPDKYGFTPLMQCAQKGYLDMLELLINHGADVNFANEAGKTSLMLAAFAKQVTCCKELRHYKAKLDIKDKGGCTAVHWAIDGNEKEVVECLIDEGSNLTWTDCNGWTPLHRVSAITGNAEIAEMLLRNKADINARDKDGKTPLMIAVINGHKHLVEMLLKEGANVSIKNEYGKTAYDMAVSMEKRMVLKILDEFLDENGSK